MRFASTFEGVAASQRPVSVDVAPLIQNCNVIVSWQTRRRRRRRRLQAFVHGEQRQTERDADLNQSCG